MTLSCLLTRISCSQSLLRGQALRTTKNILIRSSALLANKDATQFLTPERNRFDNVSKSVKFTPFSSVIQSRYASHSGPVPDYKKHSHVNLWRLERILSAALLPVVPLALITPSQTLDTIVALMIVMHTHWGLEAVVVDYVRPILFGNVVPKIGIGLLYLFSAAMLAGLLNLIYNDMGLANCILHLWKS